MTGTSRPERLQVAGVLLAIQGAVWLVTGLSALPFALAGEGPMAPIGLATVALALAVFVLARGVAGGRRRFVSAALVLELATLAGSLLLLLLPLGAPRGPAVLAVNLALPAAVAWIVRR